MAMLKSNSGLNILLTVDDSFYSEAITDLLTHISWPPKTTVHVLAFVPDRLPEIDASAQDEVDEMLALERWRGWAAARVLTTDTTFKLRHHLSVKTEICEGPLPEVMLIRAVDFSVDLIAVDFAKFQALADFRLKYPPSHLGKQAANTSLLVARPSRQIRPLNTILVIDDSLASWRAVEFMSNLSLPQWAKVTVLRVIQEQVAIPSGAEPAGALSFAPMVRAVLDLPDPTTTKVINRLQRSGARVWSSFRFGNPVDEVLAIAWEENADLIVVGAHNQRYNQPVYLDSIAQEIIKNAPCSVLAIR